MSFSHLSKMSDMWKPAALGISVIAEMLRLKSIRAMKVDSEALDSRVARSDKTFPAKVTMT
jgi:hypothetical protein